MSDAQDAPDTAAASQITDHPFNPEPGKWYGLCQTCSLGRAAHAVPPASSVEERPQPLPVAEIDKSQMEEHVVSDDHVCGAPGPAPLLSCELPAGHTVLHTGVPGGQDETARIRWGDPAPIEQDDPIGGGRVQELPAAGLSIEQEVHHDTAGKRVVDSRQDLYGDAVPNIERVARGWSIIAEAQITPQMVPLMMVWLKIVRESQSHLQDNLDDIEGYVEIMRRVVEELGE